MGVVQGEGRGDGPRVVLPGPAGFHVDARLRADGALVFQGQLLRPGMAEYEYVVTLPEDQVPALCEALGLAGGSAGEAAGAEALMAELVRRGPEITPRVHGWLGELGLRPELWAHVGD